MPIVCFPRNTKNGRRCPNISDSLSFRRVFIDTLRFVALLSGLPRRSETKTFAKRRNRAQRTNKKDERSKAEGSQIMVKV